MMGLDKDEEEEEYNKSLELHSTGPYIYKEEDIVTLFKDTL